MIFTVNNSDDHPRRLLGTRTSGQKGCHLPRPDPFDPSILEFIIKPEPLRCNGTQFELTYLSDDNQTRPGCEFMETYCKKTTFPSTTVYYNNHNQVLTRHLSSTVVDKGDRKSVIVIVFDSISHSNFIRNMPKSLKVLNELYKSHIFDGMSKVGDQSFPNAVAFLA
ncbi:hypothetical protein TELCIR_20598, partial [Teladorsagia circumcincta]